ncbi:hypothetical protein CVT26_009069 [Gymnopilus dilepis]|uniref:Uncharacterized protein n=1 Tax=Gymnopilus dilepis TaxID=231916 RepID=A0A409YR38_9AGAR|nr:hypothetical protein CVT26_009069 [Gymnopilus dilepis]
MYSAKSKQDKGAAPDGRKEEHRGVKASKWPFTEEQERYLRSLYPQFEAVVREVNPELHRYNEGVRAWNHKTSEEIMNLELFKPLISTEKPLKSWEKAVRAKFTGYLNNTLKPRLVSNTRTTTKRNDSSTGINIGSASISDNRVKNVLARAMGIFTSEVPCRELFASENEDALKAKMEELASAQPELVGGALRNRALKELFDQADKVFWENRAIDMLSDIDTNQAQFPELMATAIDAVLSRGRVGTVVTALTYACRDSIGALDYGIIYNGFNAARKERIQWKHDDHDIRAAAWQEYANNLLPRAPITRPRTLLPVDDDGLPIFPKFSLMSVTNEQILGTLQDYLLACWDHAFPGVKPIPWKDIVANPGDYYDTSYFKLPVPLDNPSSYADRLYNLHSLVNYLVHSSFTERPFRFTSSGSRRLTPSSLCPPPTNPLMHLDVRELGTDVTSSALSIAQQGQVTRQAELESDGSNLGMAMPRMSSRGPIRELFGPNQSNAGIIPGITSAPPPATAELMNTSTSNIGGGPALPAHPPEVESLTDRDVVPSAGDLTDSLVDQTQLSNFPQSAAVNTTFFAGAPVDVAIMATAPKLDSISNLPKITKGPRIKASALLQLRRKSARAVGEKRKASEAVSVKPPIRKRRKRAGKYGNYIVSDDEGGWRDQDGNPCDPPITYRD